MTETEFYDQQRWLQLHSKADELIAKDGVIISAVYKSPEGRRIQDEQNQAEFWSQLVAERRQELAD